MTLSEYKAAISSLEGSGCLNISIKIAVTIIVSCFEVE